MHTKNADMYARDGYIDRTPNQIVATIKAQLWAHGKSGRCIKVNDNGEIEIKTSTVFVVIPDNEFNLVYFDNKNIQIFAVSSKMGLTIKV